MTDSKPRKNHLQWRLRNILRSNQDGMTIASMCIMSGSDKWSVRDALQMMPDAYIDRWTKEKTRGRYAAVWCVVVPPENCPKPNK